MLHFLLTLLIQPTFSYLITLADRQAILSPVQTTLAAFPTLPTGLDLLQTSTEEIGTFLKNGSLSSVDLVKAYLCKSCLVFRWIAYWGVSDLSG